MLGEFIRKVLNLISDTTLRKWITYFANFYRKRIWSDKTFLKNRFKELMGYELNIKNPKTLNEKIQWLKLYDRTELHTICADKVLVRDYVTDLIGENYLTPLMYKTFDPDNIKITDLPEKPFIIKANHDSGSYKIIHDKYDVDIDELKNLCKLWLKNNFYYAGKEWQYKNIKPQILIEKLHIENDGSGVLKDFKIHCFHSEPRMISVDVGRNSNQHIRNWYDINWKPEKFKWSSLLNNEPTDPDYTIEEKPPVNLEKMLKYSKLLSKPFKYVRVDWYEVNGELFFGEITFHHDAGFRPILPKEYDYKLGELINL